MENTNIESYAFTWQGKRAAAAEATRPPRGTLRLCREESRAPDTTENIYIEGYNIDTLKLLQEHYRGKVNLIYIDPPYNTGGDFVYHDKFRMSSPGFDEKIGTINKNNAGGYGCSKI